MRRHREYPRSELAATIPPFAQRGAIPMQFTAEHQEMLRQSVCCFVQEVINPHADR